MKKIAALLLLLLLIISCTSKDDSPNTDDQQMDDPQDNPIQNPFRLVQVILTNIGGDVLIDDIDYNQQNQVINETFSIDDVEQYSGTYFYDEDRLVRANVSTGSEYNYFYTDDVVTSSNRIHPSFQQDFTYTYDNNANLVRTDRFSGGTLDCVTNYEYDENGNSTTHNSSCGSALISRTYNTRLNPRKLLFKDNYDKALFISNNGLISYSYQTDNVEWDYDYSYTYNEDDLVSVKITSENGKIIRTEEYIYEDL